MGIARKLGSIVGLGGFIALGAMTGCVVENDDDAGPFVEALPQQQRVQVAGPESSQSSASSSQSWGVTRAQGTDLPQGNWAESYALTREVRDGINHVAWDVLGLVWFLVNEIPPNHIDINEAVWGPYSDALEPHETRFRITAVGEDHYEYVLEGRPKGSADEWQAVLTGTGYGKAHAEHGNGSFTIDLDVARALDPFEHQDDSGTLTIEHWLAPATDRIRAEARPSDSEAWWVADSSKRPDGTGQLVIEAMDNLDDSATPALEHIDLVSKWQSDGAGRSDYTFEEGDLGEQRIDATECWGTSFQRTYWAAGLESIGDAAMCPFSESVRD